MDAAAHLEQVEAWRRDRIGRLTGPEGWLSVIGLAWLQPGPNAVGGDAGSDVVLPSSAPPRVGTIASDAGRLTFTPEPGVRVRNRHRTVDGTIELRDDAGCPPTKLAIGSVVFYAIWREGSFGVRIKDADAPARRDFTGIEHYPVDERWRIEARFEPHDPPRAATVPTVLDMTETYAVPGALAFDIDGDPYRLDAFLEDGESDLFVVFADATNRDETFGGGRFLYTPQADERGIVVLDLNRAYNPPCVFTPHATCPLPPPQNRLPVRIEAGEKRYGSKAVGS